MGLVSGMCSKPGPKIGKEKTFNLEPGFHKPLPKIEKKFIPMSEFHKPGEQIE